jgi:hypothetical protein
MRKALAALAITSMIAASCDQPVKEKPLDKLSWLEGGWEGITEEVVMRESWTKVNDKLMTGEGYVLAGTDTVFRESLKLMTVNDSMIYYVVAIPGVPDSTNFILSKYENDEAVFENPEHDFPQRIVYKKVNNDSVYAYIEGQTDKGLKRDEYPYKRISSPPKKEEKK